MFRSKIVVADNQRAALFKDQQYQKMLMPGRHDFRDLRHSLSFEMLSQSVDEVMVDDQWLLRLESNSELLEQIQLINVANDEIVILRHFNKIIKIIEPTSRVGIWNFVPGMSVEHINIDKNFEADHELLKQFIAQDMTPRVRLLGLVSDVMPEGYRGLLYVNGEFNRILEPGLYGFWGFNRHVVVKLQCVQLMSQEVNGQEILTKDRVSLRVNLQSMYQVVDAELAVNKTEDIDNYLYKYLQLALREVVGTHSLDQLLDEKSKLNDLIFEKANPVMLEMGVRLAQVGLKDIILPGDMRDILNQVVQAQKQAEANVIKRREETAATRSLLNTAKVIEGNPVLMKLKEMEAQEKIAERIDKITVVGGVGDVMGSLVKAEL